VTPSDPAAPAAPAASRRLWTLLEPVHAVTYFSPEPLTALRDAGYRGFWMGYFAGRAAPLGDASPALVHALFHNFAESRVRRALPSAWTFAPPEAALAARLDGSVAALRRHLGPLADDPASADLAEVVALLERAVDAAPSEGRALFAANRALPRPDDVLGRLWLAATCLREHRGDGHVAALLVHRVGGREAHVLQSLVTGTPREVYRASRDMDDDEWSALLDSLRGRGLVDADGGATDAARDLKAAVERDTDAAADLALTVLDADELAEVDRVLRPVTAAVVAAGEIPVDAPMGLDLRTIS
jgi:hypothetical protein